MTIRQKIQSYLQIIEPNLSTWPNAGGVLILIMTRSFTALFVSGNITPGCYYHASLEMLFQCRTDVIDTTKLANIRTYIIHTRKYVKLCKQVQINKSNIVYSYFDIVIMTGMQCCNMNQIVEEHSTQSTDLTKTIRFSLNVKCNMNQICMVEKHYSHTNSFSQLIRVLYNQKHFIFK